jgi:amidohydrolase
MVELRHDLHAHPELSNQEERTTGVVRGALAELGLTDLVLPGGRPWEGTGGVFVLEGGRPGRTVVLRADVDALPVHEQVDLPWASGTPGVMHACGHDVHTAALLGVARTLAGTRAELPGRYVLLFQPAEEALCGAKSMLEAGVLEAAARLGAGTGDPSDLRCISFHTASMLPVGLVGLRPGTAMAEAHSLALTVTGTGGHGAMPTERGNVITAAAQLLQRLGSVVDGLIHEDAACVCTVGLVRAGTAVNVVPDRARLEGTLRTFTEGQLEEALRRLTALARAVGDEEGVEVTLELPEHCPVVSNDPAATALVQAAARAVGVVDPADVFAMPPVAPSDDVGEFLARSPGCHFFVGAGRPDGSSGMHHSPTFAADDGSLRVGAAVMAAGAVSLAGASA